MIWNVIDRRNRPYRWKRINAIIEAIEHDNTCLDADKAEESPPGLVIDHERKDGISIEDAISWANDQRCPVALYIYDADDFTTEIHFASTHNRFPKITIRPGRSDKH